jgi:purine nucleosidase
VPLPGLLIDTDTASDDAVAPVMAAVAAAAEFNIWAEPEATAVVLGDEARGQLLVDRRHLAAAPNVTLVRRVNADGFRALLFEACATAPGTAERLRPVMGAAA